MQWNTIKDAFAQWKTRLGPLWWYAALLFVVQRMGDVINVAIGLVLAPKFVSQQELGVLLPIMNASAIFTLPLSLLLLPVPKFLNVFATRNETGKAHALLNHAVVVSALYTLLLLAAVFPAGGWILERLKLEDRTLLWFVAGFALTTAMMPVVTAAQQAFKLFRSMLLTALLAPYARLLGMLLLLPLFGTAGYLAAQFGVTLVTLLLPGAAIYLAVHRMAPRASYRANFREMAAYALPLLCGTVIFRVQGSAESLVIRQRLAQDVSAGYFFIAMFGSIPMYIINAITPFLWVIISDRFERGQATRRLMWQSLAFNFAVGGLITLAVALASPWLFRLPGAWPWKEYARFSHYIWVVCLLNVIRSGTTIYTTHETACRRFGFMWFAIPFSACCSALLYILPGWSLFRPWLPPPLWHWVDTRFPITLGLFLGIMLATSFAVLLCACVQLWLRSRAIRRTIGL